MQSDQPTASRGEPQLQQAPPTHEVAPEGLRNTMGQSQALPTPRFRVEHPVVVPEMEEPFRHHHECLTCNGLPGVVMGYQGVSHLLL
jgi:hypothetical protein